MSSTKPDGGCLCGAVSYEIRPGAKPYYNVICHCLNCQKGTGSAFATNSIFHKDDFTLHNPQHALKMYSDGATDSGTPLIRYFCGTCGSPVYATTGLAEQIISIFCGTYRDPARWQPPFKEQYMVDKKSWIPEFGDRLESQHTRGCHDLTK